MDKAGILCDKDRDLMHAFCRRSVDRLCGRSLLLFPLPFFQAYMDANVTKEIEKDRLIIEHALAAFAEDRPLDESDVEILFERTKEVDRTFVRKVSVPSLSITVRYEDIADIRKQRIRQIGTAVSSLLRAWQDGSTFSETVQKAYTRRQFSDMLHGILHLYNLETRMLSRSLRLFPPFSLAIEPFTENLYMTMEEVSVPLADDCARKVFKGSLAA